MHLVTTGILGSDKTVVCFSYFTRILYDMQASIQLIIVTAGPSLIDFFKALLAETGPAPKGSEYTNKQTNKQMKYV